jgi:serine protease AprX
LRRVVLVMIFLAAALARLGAGEAGLFDAAVRPLASVTADGEAPAPPAAVSAAPPSGHRAPTVDPKVAEAAKPGETLELLVSLAHPAGAQFQRRLASLGSWSFTFRHVAVAAVRLPASRLGDLRALPGVRGVYPEERFPLALDEAADAVDARRVWRDMGVTGAGVTVAVVDSGVDFTHPDLAPAMRANLKMPDFGTKGWPFPVEAPALPSVEAPDTDLTSGHGTHVAGDVAGRGVASGGKYQGMAPGAGLVGLSAGEGDSLSGFAVVAAYDWLVEHHRQYGIRIVNNSWGGSFRPFDPDSPINVATKAAADAGLAVIFAYGNDGGEMTANSEAVAPWVLGVAAGDKRGAVAEFSSGGIEPDEMGTGFGGTDIAGERRAPLAMGLYHPSVVATGVDVVSTRATGAALGATSAPQDAALPPGDAVRYTTMSGTSMAAPVAAGVAALVLEANPALGPEELRRVLQNTARPVPGSPFHRQGYGYLDAAAAVDLARSLQPLPTGETAHRLEQRQAERDRTVLALLAHPTRTWAWTNLGSDDAKAVVHRLQVPAGTTRLKFMAIPLLIAPIGVQRSLKVLDAKGAEVAVGGYAANTRPVMTLDLDLYHLPDDRFGRAHPYDSLAFGPWTVRYEAADGFEEAAVAATYAAPAPEPCLPLPGPDLALRLQDDDTIGLGPYPADPAYTYVGPVPGGSLGPARPERRLAGTIVNRSGDVDGNPRFVGEVLSAPLVIGNEGRVSLWVQGTGVPLQETWRVTLLDLPPEAGPGAVISTADVALTGPDSPTEVVVPLDVGAAYQLSAGHRLAVSVNGLSAAGSGVTLLYDSDRYPSGLNLATGHLPAGCRPAIAAEAYPPLVLGLLPD